MRITLCEVAAEGAATTAVERVLELDEGLSVLEALERAGRPLRPGEGLAVYGRRVAPEAVLHDGDRLEVAAPLLVDPREARRRRAERQGDVRVVTAGRHGSRRRLERED